MHRPHPASLRTARRAPARKALLCAALLAATTAIVWRIPVQAGSADPDDPNPVTLGEKIFSDASLSASGTLACASCHDPAHAHAQSTDLAVQPGGAGMDIAGFRAVPSLNYLSFTPPFSFADDGTPSGGFNRDGRAGDLMIQALRPLFAAHEMANAAPADLVARLARASYAAQFRQVFGENIFDDEKATVLAVTFALAQYQKLDPDFRPFDSKYDLFLAGKVKLGDAELRGLALFNRPDKGNCAGCHPSGRGPNHEPPLFTDFTYDNLGVPRNADIPATVRSGVRRPGIVRPGPHRSRRPAGAVRRVQGADAAQRRHAQGVLPQRALQDACATRCASTSCAIPIRSFSTRRDPRATVLKFDDLPAELAGNVNTVEVPYDRRPGEAPRLTEAELDDLEAFLGTLTDGYGKTSKTSTTPIAPTTTSTSRR